MKLLLTLLTTLVLLSPSLAQTSLLDAHGQGHTIPGLIAESGKDVVVLVVWCSQCGSCRGVERDLVAYAVEHADRVKLYAVSPHPADSPERIKTFLIGQGLKLDVLRDADQSLIRSYNIDRTTTALVLDRQGNLRYLGPFEGAGKGFAADAVRQVLADQEVSMKTRPLNGCPIPELP